MLQYLLNVCLQRKLKGVRDYVMSILCPRDLIRIVSISNAESEVRLEVYFPSMCAPPFGLMQGIQIKPQRIGLEIVYVMIVWFSNKMWGLT